MLRRLWVYTTILEIICPKAKSFRFRCEVGISFRPIDTQREPINKTFSGRTFTGGKKTKQFNHLIKVEAAYQTRLYNSQGLRGNSSLSKTYQKGVFCQKIVHFFSSFLIEKFPSKRLSGHASIWDCFGNMSVRNAKLLWWNKSESVNYHSLSESAKVWISKCPFWTLFQFSRLRTFW